VPERGEVWLVDFGITQKVRPALVVSVPYADADRALLGVIPHTTATRGSRWEVPITTRFLAEGAFLVQGIQPVPPRYFVRQLGTLVAGTDTGGQRHATALARTSSSEPRNLDVKDIHDFRFEDFTLTDYDPHPAIKAPISI
jgi:mRNA interferase MazF